VNNRLVGEWVYNGLVWKYGTNYPLVGFWGKEGVFAGFVLVAYAKPLSQTCTSDDEILISIIYGQNSFSVITHIR